MTEPPLNAHSLASTLLEDVVNRVFFPPNHIQNNDHGGQNGFALVSAVHDAAGAYAVHLEPVHQLHWSVVERMLENLRSSVEYSHKGPGNLRDNIASQLCEMKAGGMLTFFLSDQTNGVIFWKWSDCTLYESFRVPRSSDVERLCPTLAIEVPNRVFDDSGFRSTLANSLSHSSGSEISDMLRCSGRPVKPKLTTGHVGSTGVDKCGGPDWRSHSPLWFLIKVAIQLSLIRSPLGRASYKAFVLFFMCKLANDAVNTSFSTLLLHSISAKILRRFRKLGPSVPPWLSDTVSCTCASLSRTLGQRWQEIQAMRSAFNSPPPFDSSHLDLTKDIQLSLSHIHQYISASLADRGCDPPRIISPLQRHLRGTLHDFLSHSDDEVSDGDIHVTLYDIERAVKEDIDDWIACVTNTDGACEQLEHLARYYWSVSQSTPSQDPEHLSITLMTMIEFWVALDKLVVKEVPLLADYSPEVPLDLLCSLHLRDPVDVHRLSRASQYLLARYARAHPGWSVLSDEFTSHSFPCRYHHSSGPLQHLEHAIANILPFTPLYAKVAVFELQCPMSIHAWRSITSWISGTKRLYEVPSIRLYDIPELKPHILVNRKHSFSLYLSLFEHKLYYICEWSFPNHFVLSAYRLPSGPYRDSGLQMYLDRTTHTSNGVLAAEAGRSPNLSLHEFIAFAHLRSGGSLQWFNILRELRSRTLNFRHQEIYLLLAQASTQVGPLDGSGQLLWHQELQDVPFCHALLDELESLFIDLGVGSSDGPAMAAISLLAGILASRSSEDVSVRAIRLLGDVRYKTFGWVHELLYNTRKSPMDRECLKLLRDMAAVCRSTFDVGSTASYKLFRSAQDTEIALFCAMIIHAIPSSDVPTYVAVLLNREHRVSLTLEGSLRDAIQADASNVGVDHAVQLVWPGYRPSQRQWKPLQLPDSRWLVCQTAPTRSRPSQLVHLNLLDGSLLVDSGQLDGKLPKEITGDPMYHELFGDLDLVVITSDLPGMDFVATSALHDHYVHFVVRDDPASTVLNKQETSGEDKEDQDSEGPFEGIPLPGLKSQVPSSPPSRAGLSRHRKLKCQPKSGDRDSEVPYEGVPLLELRVLSSPPSRAGLSTCQELKYQLKSSMMRPFSKISNLLRPPAPQLRHRQCIELSSTLPQPPHHNNCPASDSRNLVIRAQSKVTDYVLELIPRNRLQEDLPRSLVEGHLHWLNHSKSIIEIRPLTKPWRQSSDNWMIHLHPEQSRVMKGSECLVDRKSATWATVSSRFGCLDDPDNLIITTPESAGTIQSPSARLSITLPRYGLSFFLNEDDLLESRDFKDMVCDEDQCIGTLFGLVNRLVLRPKVQIEADLIPRLILIPRGDSLSQRNHGVFIRLPSTGPVSYYTYQVDSELGCVKGMVDTESRLYLARLHFFTGLECRPDTLTGRTGVEEAISLTWLAGTRHAISEEWPSALPSPQMQLALAKIQGKTALSKVELRTADALLREAHLFPSEVASGLQLSKNGPLSSLVQLLHERSAPNLPQRERLWRDGLYRDLGLSSSNVDSLRQLFSSLQTNELAPRFQSQYISRLQNSVRCLQETHLRNVTSTDASGGPSLDALREHYVQCRIGYKKGLDLVKMALGPNTEFERILDQCGQWPRTTPFVLFRCLASVSPIKPPDSWKKCLISLALLALDLQRARRLLRFALDNLEDELFKELQNEGCDGWDPAERPDWLLIQLQGDFLIRRAQADVAKEIMFPQLHKNTVIQVNMGEGKSSVIVPICAVALADGHKLVRIIVPKALIPQALQLLTNKLGGLVNKPIYHFTFSRNLHIDVKQRLTFLSEHRGECGIIVMQPEHILSLKLGCLETQLPEHGIRRKPTPTLDYGLYVPTRSPLKPLAQFTHVSTAMVRAVKRWYRRSMASETLTSLQRFLETNARDILDESDDVLRPQLQLIYAIGRQRPFEGSPERWSIVQQVLGLVKRYAYLLSTADSHAIWCEHRSPGSFPYINIPQVEGREKLLSLVVEEILDGHLCSLKFHSEPELSRAVREFIFHRDVPPDIVKMVKRYAYRSTGWGPLLLLRGLLAHNILFSALTQRRWRVDYGLDPTSPPRTLLAIPYRAKDVPAETAEFGHPDMTILLTCLSYYYGGLNEEQLGNSFELLLQQDDPSSEYLLWLEHCDTTSVPDLLRKLSGVNIKSWEQWAKYLVPLFSRNKRAIDLYLSKFVFPKHATEFDQKISGSYWDIAEQKNHLVTGFSGTNDGQYLLPTSIVQDDPDHLRQTETNARVLACLLQPENSSYMVTSDENTTLQWTTSRFLQTVVAQEPQIRVLLDVGAQILDLSNFQLAKAWLASTPPTEIAGAVYFTKDDKLMVLTRNGTSQPLSSSPLIHELYRCVTYLDHAHTRGIDLNFPSGFRAAVTLGDKVTKDRLAQGCMRMRKLGHGHSVMFFAPHEVDKRIRGLVSKENQNMPVTTADILHWAIHETWSDIQRRAPYWAQQGIDHQTRQKAWSGFCRNKATPEKLIGVWVRPELSSLADMYMPCNPLDATATELPPQIRERCRDLGILPLRNVRMDEEQEREVSREIEREREGKRREFRPSPAWHSLHPELIKFVRTGNIPSLILSKAFHQVFATGITVASTSQLSWSPYILATADFCQTIKESGEVDERMADYLRPVQWVLSGKTSGRDVLVLVSPFEANWLMPEIRISEHVHLHLYIPRTTKRMKPSDDLRLYSVPPLPSEWTSPWMLINQLNLFAGQLYLSDHSSYVRLCQFLGIETAQELEQNAGTVVTRSWFSNLGSSGAKVKDRFKGTSLPPVMRLLAMRRGMDFSDTHMGRILDGWPLTEKDFEGSASRPALQDDETTPDHQATEKTKA